MPGAAAAVPMVSVLAPGGVTGLALKDVVGPVGLTLAARLTEPLKVLTWPTFTV